MSDGAMPSAGGLQAPAAPTFGRKEQGLSKAAQVLESEKTPHPAPRSVRSSRETRSHRLKDDSSVATSAAAKWYRRRAGGVEGEPDAKTGKERDAAAVARPIKKKAGKAQVVKEKNEHTDSCASLGLQLLLLVFFLLLSGAGLVFWSRHMAVAGAGAGPGAERVETLERYVSDAVQSIQAQLERVDSKIGKQIMELKEDLEKRMASQEASGKEERDMLVARLEDVQACVRQLELELETNQVPMDDAAAGLSEEETRVVVKNYLDAWKSSRDEKFVSMEQVQAAARQVALEELEKHAADGVARVDYAVESGGGRVVDHSEAFFHHKSKWTSLALSFLPGSHHRHPLANKVLQPSLGEPGQCLPLRGSNVYVDIALRTAILPEAVTLEHVAKQVAFDLSSAPKDFRIYGWQANQTQAHRALGVEMHRLLGQCTYALDGPRLQTFNLSHSSAPQTINMVRLHVLSNYGSQTHTCLYRLRVHGSHHFSTVNNSD